MKPMRIVAPVAAASLVVVSWWLSGGEFVRGPGLGMLSFYATMVALMAYACVRGLE